MRFIIWERSVQKKTDFWIVLCCILKEPKINMLEFSCWCKKNSQSIHEELHSIPLIFLNKKSEIWNDFTIFEKWKVKNFLPSLFSRSESENQMTQNRDREVKVKIKWLKIEIEKWIFKKILENSRESRLSLVTGPRQQCARVQGCTIPEPTRQVPLLQPPGVLCRPAPDGFQTAQASLWPPLRRWCHPRWTQRGLCKANRRRSSLPLSF